MNIVASFVLILLILFGICISTSAQEYSYIGTEEIKVPEDMNFEFRKTCSGHLCFMQASACESGRFLVFSRQIGSEGYPKSSMKNVYVDIYDANGQFREEISFVTSLDVAVEMTETTANIIFQHFVVIYDLATGELHCFSTPEDANITRLFLNLRKETFSSGGWEYRCVKSAFTGYKMLMRSNNYEEQILVEMAGLQNSFASQAHIGGIIGFIGLVIGIVFVVIKKKKRQKTGEGLRKTGDGSLS